jgi:hypothetical protein
MKHLTRNRIVAALILGLTVRTIGGARAQSQPPTEYVPKEVQALLVDLSDIDKMRVLGPMKLTQDQLGQLITTMTKATDDYNRKVSAAAVPPIKQIAKEIKETRAKVIAGAPIPKDFDEKVKKIQDDFLKRRAAEDKNTLKSLSDAIRKIYTKEQVDRAIKLARTLTARDGEELKGTDDQFFNLYVKGTFIDYAGIVPLLEAIKKATGEQAATFLAKPQIGARTLHVRR